MTRYLQVRRSTSIGRMRILMQAAVSTSLAIRPIFALGISLLLILVQVVRKSYLRSRRIRARPRVVSILPIVLIVTIMIRSSHLQVRIRRRTMMQSSLMQTQILQVMTHRTLRYLRSGVSSTRMSSLLRRTVSILVDGSLRRRSRARLMRRT